MTLKFRVWNERYKDFNYWGFDGIGGFTGPPTGSGLTLDDCEESEIYTEMSDENGKILFENDIVEIFHLGQKRIVQIVYKDGMFCYKWPDGNINVCPIDTKKSKYWGHSHYYQ